MTFMRPRYLHGQGRVASNNASVGTTDTVTATETVGGHRVIARISDTSFTHADATVLSHHGCQVGISLNAANIGDPLEIRWRGEIEFGGWSWTPGEDIMLSEDGLMAHTVPVGAAFSQRIAYALSATKIRIDIQEPILL